MAQPIDIGIPLPTQTAQPVDIGIEPKSYTTQPATTQSGGYAEDNTGYWGDLGYLLGNGFTDSVRGGAQLLGVKEDEMRGQQEMVNQLLDQHGAAGYAAWIGGMVLDPVGWLIPMSRMRNLGKIAARLSGVKEAGMAGKAAEAVAGGAAGGAVAGGLSYVDEEAGSLLGNGSMSRGEQAIIGALGGGALMGIGGSAAAVLRKKNDDKVKAMVKEFKAEARKDTDRIAKLKKEGSAANGNKPMEDAEIDALLEGEAWTRASGVPVTTGEKVWSKVGQNPEVAIPAVGAGLGGFAGYQYNEDNDRSGINQQTEPLFGDLFADMFTNEGPYARWRNALMGAAVGAGGTKYAQKKKLLKSHWFTPDLNIEDGMQYAKARARPRAQSIVAKDVDPLVKEMEDFKTSMKYDKKMSDSDIASVSELMYKMVNQGPQAARKLAQGLTDDEKMTKVVSDILDDSPELAEKVRSLTIRSRKTIRDMGEKMVKAGLLDKRIWTKNKGKYLHRIYSNPGEAQDIMSRSGYQVIGDELEPRGLTREVDEAEWAEIQKAPQKNDNGEDLAWERWDADKDQAIAGKFTIRRDWTELERKSMGEHMDLLDAFNKTGNLLAHDISAGMYMDELAKMPTVSSAVRTIDGLGQPTKKAKNSTPELSARDTRASMSSNPPDVGPMKYDHNVQVPRRETIRKPQVVDGYLRRLWKTLKECRVTPR